MTASPPRPVPPLVRALLDVREILERARRTGDQREIETAVEAVAERTARALLHPPGNTTRNSDIAPCGPCVSL